jgi:hypothetical protein
MKLAERICHYLRSLSRRSPPRRTAIEREVIRQMAMTIQFDTDESCSYESYEQRALAIWDLVRHVDALEERGIIKNVYMTDDVLDAELEAIEAAQQAEQAAREPASA